MEIKIMKRFGKISYYRSTVVISTKKEIIYYFLNSILPAEIDFRISETVNQTFLVNLFLCSNEDIEHSIELTKNETCLDTIQAELENFAKNVRSWVEQQEDFKVIDFEI